MKNKIIITGATGLVGKAIAAKLIERGDEVVVFTRSPHKAQKILPGAFKYVKWDYKDDNKDWVPELNGTDAVVHLAGENIMGRRWSKEHKKNILESRVIGTKQIVEAIGKSDKKPKALICASAIGYYGTSETEVFDETSPPGNDFLANVTKAWEDESKAVEAFGVRRVSIRLGMVLSKEGGALAKMITPFKFFVGGPLGSGRQWISWIHIDDAAGLFLHTLDNSNITGAVNAVAPNSVTMNEFAKELGKKLNRPSVFRVPAFVIKIILGEGADVILKGAKVVRLINEKHHKYYDQYTEMTQASC